MVELDGIEPSVGQPVTARPTSPGIAPQRTYRKTRPAFPLTQWIRWPFACLGVSYINDTWQVKRNTLQNRIKVILSVQPVYYWSFSDYVEGSHNPVQDWYGGELSDSGRLQFDALLKNTAKIESHLQWAGFKFLKGEPKKHRIWQLDFIAENRQYRILGIFGSVRRQAILLLGCYHKGKIYTPPNALDTGCKRAKNLTDQKAGTIGRQIKHDL